MNSDILRDLVVSDRDILREAAVKAKPLIAITEETGEIFLRVPRTQLGAKDALALYLVGQYFLRAMEKADTSRLSVTDLAKKALVDNNIASARLAELASAGWVTRTGKGEYEVNPHVLNSLLDEIQASKNVMPLTQTSDSNLEKASHSEVAKPSGIPKGATEAILFVLGTDWGNKPRDWTEIRDELRRQGRHFSQGSLSGTLTLLTQSHRVRRIREGRFYKYVLP